MDQLTKFVNQSKQKKHGIIVNPVTTDVLCVLKKLGGEINIREWIVEENLKEKDKNKAEKLLEQLDTSIVQWKEKVKKTTDIKLEEKVNPV
jgi:hypothetical protein